MLRNRLHVQSKQLLIQSVSVLLDFCTTQFNVYRFCSWAVVTSSNTLNSQSSLKGRAFYSYYSSHKMIEVFPYILYPQNLFLKILNVFTCDAGIFCFNSVTMNISAERNLLLLSDQH